jgi:hypothetical protein
VLVPPNELVQIYIYDLYENKKIPFNLALSSTGKDLKKLYFEAISEDETKYKCRLLFGGSELQDDHNLFQHNIKEGFQIQIIKSIIE